MTLGSNINQPHCEDHRKCSLWIW